MAELICAMAREWQVAPWSALQSIAVMPAGRAEAVATAWVTMAILSGSVATSSSGLANTKITFMQWRTAKDSDSRSEGQEESRSSALTWSRPA
eukprot:68641-Pyramimonas_sp.AAC.1